MPTNTDHTSKQFDVELEALRARVLKMGGLVEEQIKLALEGLMTGDVDLCDKVEDNDHKVNALEVGIDEDVSKSWRQGLRLREDECGEFPKGRREALCVRRKDHRDFENRVDNAVQTQAGCKDAHQGRVPQGLRRASCFVHCARRLHLPRLCLRFERRRDENEGDEVAKRDLSRHFR